MSEDPLTRLSASPDLYVQKIDLTREAALVMQFDLTAYRAASFLDDRILIPTAKGLWTPLGRLIEAAELVRDARPVHFIFHTGHVGSTLVSRLLDETRVVLSLREPLPLRTLADAEDSLGQCESLLSHSQFESLRHTLMQLWARGYDETRAIVVKATSSSGRIAGSLLDSQVASRAIYLNVGVEPYLATLLAGKNSSIDLRGHGPVRIRRLQSRLTASLMPLHALTLGELAALSWLAETWNQRDAAKMAGERLLAVDFDRFLANVENCMDEILRHFGLSLDPKFLSEIAHSPVLTRYSKAAEFEYSPQIRAEILNESRQRNRDEIRRGLGWLENLAKAECGVAEILNSAGAAS
ncbi:MAG: hypothetical protein ACREV5_15505 [Steroidobacter sp.]